jgi:hypothetical protein
MVYTEREIFELRQRVDKLERQVSFLMANLGAEYRDEPNQGVSSEISATRPTPTITVAQKRTIRPKEFRIAP